MLGVGGVDPHKSRIVCRKKVSLASEDIKQKDRIEKKVRVQELCVKVEVAVLGEVVVLVVVVVVVVERSKVGVGGVDPHKSRIVCRKKSL